jgi:uncharacterized membrane protein (DUF106 family)
VFFAEPAIEMALLTMVLAIMSFGAQKKFIDQDRQKRDQQRLKDLQKEMKELMNKTDEASLKRLHKLEREMLEITRDMMGGTMKVMVITTPLFLGALWFFRTYYDKININLPVPIPWFTNFDWGQIASWFNFRLYEQTTWLGWYFLVYLITNLLLNGAWSLYKKSREKK